MNTRISVSPVEVLRIIALSVLIVIGRSDLVAQLNIVPKSDPLKIYTKDNALPYDSLTNIDNYAALPGQTLFMSGSRHMSNGYVESFYTGNFLTDHPKIYGTGATFGSTPADKVDGKYFDVEKVWLKQGPAGGVGCCILLKEKDSGDEVYFKPYSYARTMICTGYYEKLKRHIGHRFLALPVTAETISGDKMMMEEGREYRCADIAIEMNSDGIVLIMEDADGGQVKGYPAGRSVHEFVGMDEIADAEKRFGRKFGRDIAMHHVVAGMTAEMVLAAWGKPDLKRTAEKTGTTKEYWRYYRTARSVELENGVVVEVFSY